MSEMEEVDLETRRWFRSFVIRHPWPPFLVACGILGLGGYRLGVALALWEQPRGSGVVGVLWTTLASLPVSIGRASGGSIPG